MNTIQLISTNLHRLPRTYKIMVSFGNEKMETLNMVLFLAQTTKKVYIPE